MESHDISGLYQSLVQHKIHQDQFLWSRIQTLHALQVAVIGGGFAAHFSWGNSLLSGSFLVSGGVVSLIMFFLVIGDYADMKVNEETMKDLASSLLPPFVKAPRWVDDTVWYRKYLVRGHHMIYAYIVMLILVDFVLGVLMFCRPGIFGEIPEPCARQHLLSIPISQLHSARESISNPSPFGAPGS